MPVPLVLVARTRDAVEHGARRVERATERMAMDAVDEGCPVAAILGCRLQALQFRDEAIAQLIIRVERQDPVRADLGQAEIALLGEAVERPVDHVDPRVPGEDVERTVGAATVDHDDAPGPIELRQRPLDVRDLVEGDQQRRDEIAVHGASLSGPWPASRPTGFPSSRSRRYG